MKFVLMALNDCPMDSEALPVVEILENAKDSETRQLAANALSSCASPPLLDRCIEVAKSTSDPKLPPIILRCISFKNTNLGSHFPWIVEQLENNDKSIWAQSSVVEFLSKAKIGQHQSRILARCILPGLEDLLKNGIQDLHYVLLGAVQLLSGDDLEKACSLLEDILLDENQDISAKHQACSILSENPSRGTAEALLKTLDQLHSTTSPCPRMLISNELYSEPS